MNFFNDWDIHYTFIQLILEFKNSLEKYQLVFPKNLKKVFLGHAVLCIFQI